MDKEQQYPSWINKLVPIVFSIAGVGLLILGSKDIISGFSSSNWKTTDGIVTESSLLNSQSSSKSKGNNYKVLIRYSYSIDEKLYTSEKILFGMSSYSTLAKGSKERAYEWLSKYPRGANVKVFFDSSDHTRCTLNTGVHYTAWIIPGGGLLFILCVPLMLRKDKKLINNGESVSRPSR